METGMSRNLKIAIVFSILLCVTVVATIFASVSYEQQIQQTQTPGFPFIQRQPTLVNPADLEFYYVIRTVLSTINIVLLVVLVISYATIYVKTRSEFTIGLLIFAGVFLVKDIASSPFIYRAFRFDLFGLGPFAFIPDLLELAALSVLLYLSVKY